MAQRFPKELLRSLRNDLSINDLIRVILDLPWKERDAHLRFLCPLCSNPRTNLARCFRCGVNFNPIDLVMAVEGCAFVDSVKILTPLIETRRPVSGKETP